MKQCAFTICAKNYLGLAEILKINFCELNPNVDFKIFIVDDLDSNTDYNDYVYSCKDVLNDQINEELYLQMAFKYNLTEFCTSVKPFCFLQLIYHQRYDKCIYLDPDIHLFNSLEPIFERLDHKKIIITPHVLSSDVSFLGERSESGLMSTGIYNLGFLALAKSDISKNILLWWAERLKDKCFIDPLESYFTDQKWVDFWPALIDQEHLEISRNYGLNVAPWNFFEREFYDEEGILYVRRRADTQKSNGDKLLFVHFSGYNYKMLLDGKIAQNNIENLANNQDVADICESYGKFLKVHQLLFKKYIDLKYSYNEFKNGTPIASFHRRIFRSLIEEGERFTDPFSVADGSIYKVLANKKLLFGDAQSLDKVTKSNYSGVGRKLKLINLLARIYVRIMGISSFVLLLKFVRPYSKFENQIHLVDDKYKKL